MLLCSYTLIAHSYFAWVKKAQKIPKQYTRALVDNTSISNELKQFDIVLATESPVFRRHWEEIFYEILSCTKEHMRTERLDGGVVPLLDNHDKYTGVTKQYGVVISYSIKNGQCRATVQFSTREDLQGIWNDIEAGSGVFQPVIFPGYTSVK